MSCESSPKKGKVLKVILLVLALLLILGGIGVCWLVVIAGRLMPFTASASDLHSIIAYYIKQNCGDFPASEEDLVRQHFLKKADIAEGRKYFLTCTPEKPDPKGEWRLIGPWFDLLKIAYGAKVENMELTDGKLYDKSTGGQILLIDGPYKKHVGKYYEELSLDLYKLMLNEKQKAKTCPGDHNRR